MIILSISDKFFVIYELALFIYKILILVRVRNLIKLRNVKVRNVYNKKAQLSTTGSTILHTVHFGILLLRIIIKPALCMIRIFFLFRIAYNTQVY